MGRAKAGKDPLLAQPWACKAIKRNSEAAFGRDVRPGRWRGPVAQPRQPNHYSKVAFSETPLNGCFAFSKT